MWHAAWDSKYNVYIMQNQVRAPAGQRHKAVDRSTNTTATHSSAPQGLSTKHTQCALSLSSVQLVWPYGVPIQFPIARFLRVFYTTARFLRVFYTLDCPTNQYPLSSGCGGREQINLLVL
mgnify:FL=1|jgi:hypothetical protein